MRAVTADLSAATARRIVLGAQGFADATPTGKPDIRHLRRVLRRVGLIQMDSVNIVARAHYMPMYSRLGPYPTTLLDRAAHLAPRELFEYWGHEASLVSVDLHPALRWRMAQAENYAWGSFRKIAVERPDFVKWVRDEVAQRGPVTAREIETDDDHQRPRNIRGMYAYRAPVKTALEWLFWCGEVTAAARLPSFERQYDLTERVLPAHVVHAPTPEPAEAYRRLVRVAAGALGVATEADLRDYFRLPAVASRGAVAELVDAGELVPVRVAGWRQPAYLDPAAKRPRAITARTLVSPFDPLVWERSRAERLFGFTYRIEIYVPAARRVHGYYVLPFLLDDALVARVDLKADRAAGVLRVPAAWIEPDPPGGPARVAAELAAELRRLAGWLGLAEIAAPERGDLAAALAAELSAGAAGKPPSGIVGTSAKGRT